MEVGGCYFVSGGQVGLTDKSIGVKEGTMHISEREIMQEVGRASGKALKLEGFWRGVSTGESPESCLRGDLGLGGAMAWRSCLVHSGVTL